MNFLRRIFKQEIAFFLVAPALVWELLFLYFPLVILLLYSVTMPHDATGKVVVGTLCFYKEVLSGLYAKMFLNSFLIATSTMIICLCIAYPVAYFLAFKARRFRTVLLFFLIMPSWTNLIVQVYAWFFLLEKNSILNQLLYKIGVFSQPMHLLNNSFATTVGMVYCFLPFMTLPIYSALEKVDRRLLEASADLGASRIQTLTHVIFPLSLPGVVAGCLLVFVPSFSEFAIPQLLGGSKYALWGSVIVSKFMGENDFNTGAALAAVGVLVLLCLILFLVIVYSLYQWLSRKIYIVQSSEQLEQDLSKWGEFHGGE